MSTLIRAVCCQNITSWNIYSNSIAIVSIHNQTFLSSLNLEHRDAALSLHLSQPITAHNSNSNSCFQPIITITADQSANQKAWSCLSATNKMVWWCSWFRSNTVSWKSWRKRFSFMSWKCSVWSVDSVLRNWILSLCLLCTCYVFVFVWDAFIRGGKNWDTLGLYLANWGACAEDIHENTLEIYTLAL